MPTVRIEDGDVGGEDDGDGDDRCEDAADDL